MIRILKILSASKHGKVGEMAEGGGVRGIVVVGGGLIVLSQTRLSVFQLCEENRRDVIPRDYWWEGHILMTL